MNEKLKKYAQFMSVAEYESLLDALRKQRQLMKRMQQLEYYREKHGLSTFKQIDELNKEREKLKESRRLKKQEKRMKLENSRLSLTRNRHIFNESSHTSGKKSINKKKKKRDKFEQDDERTSKKTTQRMQISRSCTTTPSKRVTRAAIGHFESPSKFMRSFNGRVNTNHNRTLSSKLNNDLYDDERDTDEQSNQAEEDDDEDRTLNCNDDSDEEQEEEEEEEEDDEEDENVDDDDDDEEENESILTEDMSENGQKDDEEDETQSDENEDDEDDDDGYLYNLVEDVSSKKGKRNEKVNIDRNEEEEEEENEEETVGDEDEENDYENSQLDDEEEEQGDASSERMDINESEEEDLSSAGAASSGGSAVNETDNIVRRLRRLNTRNGSPLKTKVQNGAFGTLLNTSTSKYHNGTNGLAKHSAATKTANKLKKKSLKTRQLSKSFREHSSPKSSSSSAQHSSLIHYGSPNMKRVCSMPGYNLLTENEKKVFKQAFI